jgi:hypothetical protein
MDARLTSSVAFSYTRFLFIMLCTVLYYKGFVIRVPCSERANAEYPGINAWFDAMEELPAYQLTKSDYYTHAWDLPPQLGGCRSEQGSKPYEENKEAGSFLYSQTMAESNQTGRSFQGVNLPHDEKLWNEFLPITTQSSSSRAGERK